MSSGKLSFAVRNDGIAASGSFGKKGQYAQFNVSKGDNLTSIAAKFLTTPTLLQTLNPVIVDPELVAPGQTLWVPGGDAACHISSHTCPKLHASESRTALKEGCRHKNHAYGGIGEPKKLT
jgi:spore germination protein YaaH